MTDVVVTVPKGMWEEWIAEGDLPKSEESGTDYWFFLAGGRPLIHTRERVYIVAHGRLRGFAPLDRMMTDADSSAFALVRRGGAEAVTIDEPIRGFRGWRYVWWKREDERPFPEWQTP